MGIVHQQQLQEGHHEGFDGQLDGGTWRHEGYCCSNDLLAICDEAPLREFRGEDASVAIARRLPGVCHPCEDRRIVRRAPLENVQEHNMPRGADQPQVEDTGVLGRWWELKVDHMHRKAVCQAELLQGLPKRG